MLLSVAGGVDPFFVGLALRVGIVSFVVVFRVVRLSMRCRTRVLAMGRQGPLEVRRRGLGALGLERRELTLGRTVATLGVPVSLLAALRLRGQGVVRGVTRIGAHL
jgi:hypothetical protein